MESSTVVAFRALVLVACLIVVPLAAIFGSQFPNVVKSVLIDRIFPNGVPGMAHEEPSLDPAPAFAAVSEAAPWPSGQGATTGSGAIATGQPGAGAAPAWSASGVEPVAAWNQPAGQVRPAWGEGPAGGQPGAVEQAAVTLPADPRQGGLPNLNPVANPSAAMGAAGMAAPGAHLVAQPDRFTVMERRLRELGATYYLLETWGNDYRCHCKMAIANDPSHTRPFEATDTDPLRAMGRVVEQVEAWRAGRLP